MQSRRIAILAINGVALLFLVVALCIFIFLYGQSHYFPTRLKFLDAQRYLERGEPLTAISYYIEGVRTGFEAGIRWLAAEPFLRRAPLTGFAERDHRDALVACKQAQAIISGYDFEDELARRCAELQGMVDVENKCAQDCNSFSYCDVTPACPP